MRRRSILAQADALEIEGLSAGKHGIDRTQKPQCVGSPACAVFAASARVC